MDEVMAWIQQKASTTFLLDSNANYALQLVQRLPDVYKNVSVFADVLPGWEMCPAYPFSSFVINFNVSTGVHHDVNDLAACLVMAIGDCTGGELCLVEPSIIIPLQSGDLVVFPSFQISHFNMHYKGQRASLVLHSDKHGHKYAMDRNGLVYFHIN